MTHDEQEKRVEIPLKSTVHAGLLGIPAGAAAIVLFAHGSGSSWLNPRHIFVVQTLRSADIATWLFDLLTEHEDRIYANRFNIDLPTESLLGATEWPKQRSRFKDFSVGYFGASRVQPLH